MSQQGALEKQALDQLRRNDLRGAHGTLSLLASLRPGDIKVSRRIQQVEELLRRREDQQVRMHSEPLRYAHAYIKAGRLEDGLRLLRAAITKDPDNPRLKELALQLARRLKANTAEEDEARASERRRAEERLRTAAAPRTSPPPAPPVEAAPPELPAVRALRQLLDRVRDRRRSPSRWLSTPRSEGART